MPGYLDLSGSARTLRALTSVHHGPCSSHSSSHTYCILYIVFWLLVISRLDRRRVRRRRRWTRKSRYGILTVWVSVNTIPTILYINETNQRWSRSLLALQRFRLPPRGLAATTMYDCTVGIHPSGSASSSTSTAVASSRIVS